jgi:hypothetical protein
MSKTTSASPLAFGTTNAAAPSGVPIPFVNVARAAAKSLYRSVQLPRLCVVSGQAASRSAHRPDRTEAAMWCGRVSQSSGGQRSDVADVPSSKANCACGSGRPSFCPVDATATGYPAAMRRAAPLQMLPPEDLQRQQVGD